MAPGMSSRRRVLLLWGVLGLLAAAILLVAYRPLAVGFACYWRAAGGEPGRAEVVGKHEEVGLILVLRSGSRAGTSCTAGTSPAIYRETRTGDVLDVVVLRDRPGECELVSTLRASAAVLWVATGLLLVLLLGIGLLGVFLQRSFARVPAPTTRLDVGELQCPRCGARMNEGYLPLLAGLHWRGRSEAVGLPHALAGLPGTVGWRGRP